MTDTNIPQEAPEAPAPEAPEVSAESPEVQQEAAQAVSEAPVADPTLNIPEAPAEPELAPLDMAAAGELYRETLANGGELTEETLAGLEKRGLGADVVKLAIAGVEMQMQTEANAIAAEVGGAEAVQEALQWASNNLDADAQAEFNAAMDNGSQVVRTALVKDLVQRSGVRAVTVGGTLAAGGTQPYPNREAFMEALKDPRYATRPDYRDEVDARHAKSAWVVR